MIVEIWFGKQRPQADTEPMYPPGCSRPRFWLWIALACLQIKTMLSWEMTARWQHKVRSGEGSLSLGTTLTYLDMAPSTLL